MRWDKADLALDKGFEEDLVGDLEVAFEGGLPEDEDAGFADEEGLRFSFTVPGSETFSFILIAFFAVKSSGGRG